VRPAGLGTVVFAGGVTGTLHVVIAHANGFRTSYSFLVDVSVRAGQVVDRGAVLGHAGGTGPEHDAGVLHFGLRVGDRYVDPMQLFRPRDLTELVRLVPAGSPPARPWVSPDRDRADLELGLSFQSRAIAAPGVVGPDPRDDGGCGDGIPVIGDAVSTACDTIDWAADTTVAALDEGLSLLRDAGKLGREWAEKLAKPLHALVQALAATATAAYDVTFAPMVDLAADLVEIGKRFWEWTQRVCSTNSPPADGTGGDGHLLMAVGGIDSHTFDDGSSFNLDTKALGYANPDVNWFSYAPGAASYQKGDTHGDLRKKAALLADQLARMALDHPGRAVDLIAHSQGGVVVDWFLVHIYKEDPDRYPPLDTVVTLSTPHQGAPLAAAGSKLRASSIGRALTDEVDRDADYPPSDSPAVRQLAVGSDFMAHLFDGGLPDKVDVTSIGGTDDAVVPANHIGVPGGQQIVVDVDGLNDHHEIPSDPRALMAVRAALEHKALPCTSLIEGIRSAIEPVVLSRVAQDVGRFADFEKFVELGAHGP
jgi:Peptidase family M23